jgi:hypothetical protein
VAQRGDELLVVGEPWLLNCRDPDLGDLPAVDVVDEADARVEEDLAVRRVAGNLAVVRAHRDAPFTVHSSPPGQRVRGSRSAGSRCNTESLPPDAQAARFAAVSVDVEIESLSTPPAGEPRDVWEIAVERSIAVGASPRIAISDPCGRPQHTIATSEAAYCIPATSGEQLLTGPDALSQDLLG